MKLTTRLSVFVSCLLAQIMSAYIFVKYAINSTSDLWQLCATLIIVAGVTELMVIHK